MFIIFTIPLMSIPILILMLIFGKIAKGFFKLFFSVITIVFIGSIIYEILKICFIIFKITLFIGIIVFSVYIIYKVIYTIWVAIVEAKYKKYF